MSFLEELNKVKQMNAIANLNAQRQAAQDQYNAKKSEIDAKYQQPTGLAAFLGGIGKTIGDIGTGVYDLIGSGVASGIDLFTGKAGTQENLQAFKKDLYKTDNMKDAYAKSAGTALNAATTLATTALPIAGVGAAGGTALARGGQAAGKALGTLAGNTAAGAISGIADELQQQGANADFGQAMKRAAAGAAGGLAGGAIGGKIGNANSRLGSMVLNNNLAKSTLGRGAIAGAVGGATGAGTAAALDGGDIGNAALQGATSGAISGAAQSGLMSLANTAKQDLWDAQKTAKAKKQAKSTANVVADVKTPTNAAEEPFMAYGESALAGQTRKNRIADKLSKFGDSLEGAQSNVTRAAARDLGIESTGRVIENVRKKTGLTNLDTQAQLAKELTGGENSLMDMVQRNALAATEDGGNGYLADTTGLLGEVNAIVDKHATTTALGGEKGVQKIKDEIRADILNRNQDLIAKSNNLKGVASDLRGKSIVSPSEGDTAKAKIYTEVANKLDDLSYSSIPKENVKDMFDVTINEMRARATQAQNNGNTEVAKAYNQLADSLNKQPRTIKAYRAFKKDFVDTSKIAKLTNQAQNGAAFQLGTSAAGTVKRTGAALLQEPVNKGLAKLGGVINQVADNLDSVSTQYTPQNGAQVAQAAVRTPTQPISEPVDNYINQFIGRTSGNIEGGKVLDATRSAAEYQNLNDSKAAIDAIDAQLLAQQQAQQQSQQNQNLVRIANAMDSALAAGDIASYNTLADLYQTAYKINQAQNPTQTSELSTAEKNQIAKLESAGTALDELEALYTKAGGGQGIIGGNIANFLGGLGLNSDVNTYNQLAQGLINQIGAAIGKTDSLNTEGEVQRALSLVPKITDDNQTAMNKLATLRQLLQTNTGTYNQLYGA